MPHAKFTSSFRYSTGTEVFKWYERRFDRTNYTNIIGTFDGLFLYGGPYQQGVSTHIPKIISDMINSIPSSDYMLCPLYRKTIDKNNVTNGGDFQLGITGTAHYEESPIDTLHREVTEELGLLINTLPPGLLPPGLSPKEVFGSPKGLSPKGGPPKGLSPKEVFGSPKGLSPKGGPPKGLSPKEVFGSPKGLSPLRAPHDVDSKWDMYSKDGKKETYGIKIDINNTKINTVLPPILSNRIDNKNHKIACIIHGKEYDILDKYLAKSEIIQWPNEDNIIGVLAISVFMVKRYLLSPFKSGFIRQTPPIVEHPLVFE